jgi:hypothetical protein
MKKLGMLAKVDIIQLAEIGYKTGLGRFLRNSAESSGKASRSTTRRRTTLWPLRS